jgi:hypothetical protein
VPGGDCTRGKGAAGTLQFGATANLDW